MPQNQKPPLLDLIDEVRTAAAFLQERGSEIGGIIADNLRAKIEAVMETRTTPKTSTRRLAGAAESAILFLHNAIPANRPRERATADAHIRALRLGIEGTLEPLQAEEAKVDIPGGRVFVRAQPKVDGQAFISIQAPRQSMLVRITKTGLIRPVGWDLKRPRR